MDIRDLKLFLNLAESQHFGRTAKATHVSPSTLSRQIQRLEERREIISELAAAGYQVIDLSDDEMAKLHVRYMVGGHPSKPLRERLFSFEFPESPGALLKFLSTLGTNWNISLFHYRSHGTDFGRVLAAFELSDNEPEFEQDLTKLGYICHDESDNPSFQFFLAG